MEGITASIRDLEEVFLADPKEGHERLKQFFEEQRAEFLRQAIALLSEGTPTSFSQLVQQICQKEAGTLEQILFTADLLSLDETAQLLKIQGRNNPAHQVNLLQSVRREIDRSGMRLAQRELMRLLEILAKSVEMEKLGGMLVSLCEHSDERLRSKVAVLSGVVAKQLPKHINLLKDVDPRVRANAVQALWGKKDPESLQLLIDASRDDHHRVAANALLGRYLAGDLGAVPGLFRLVRETELPRQLAGVWAIGESGDPRFLSTVNEGLVLHSGRLKLALRNAGRKIRKRVEEARSGEQLKLDLLHSDFEGRGRVRLHFHARNGAGMRLASEGVKGTQLIVHDGEMRVDQIQFQWLPSPAARRVAIIMPMRTGVETALSQELMNGMSAALRIKPEQEAWAILKYVKTNPSTGRTRADALIAFLEDREALSARALPSASTLGSIEQALEKVLEAIGDDEQAEKRIVLVLDPELAASWQPPASWQELLRERGVVLSVVDVAALSAESVMAVRKLVQAGGGTYHRVEKAPLLAREIEKVVRCMQPHYYLTYHLGRMTPGGEEEERVSIELYQPRGYGKLVLRKDGQVVEENAEAAR